MEVNGRTMILAIDEDGSLWEYNYSSGMWTHLGQPES